MDFDSLNHRPNAEILRKKTFLCHENLINTIYKLMLKICLTQMKGLLHMVVLHLFRICLRHKYSYFDVHIFFDIKSLISG